MALKFANNAESVLASSINSTQTSIIVQSGQGSRFPAIGALDYFLATIVDLTGNLEIVRVTARVSDTFTVMRAQEGTIGRSFPAGSYISNQITAGQLASFFNTDNDGSGSGLDADKLDGMEPSSAATPDTIVRRDGSGGFSATQVTASTFNGSFFGNVTGNVTGNATGNASTANSVNSSLSAGVGLAVSDPFNGSQPRTFSLGTPSTLSTSTVNSSSGDTHSHAVIFPEPTTDQVLTAMAGATAASTGTTMLLRSLTAPANNYGDTRDGGSLSAASANGLPKIVGANVEVLPGAWRCLGRSDSGTLDTAARANQTTLWLRIA